MGESGSNHKTVIFIGLMLGMLVAAGKPDYSISSHAGDCGRVG
jgi:hypothetical protein